MKKISMPTTVGKSRNSFLPRNGHQPAAVQQWSNEVRLCTISPNGAPDHFDAVVNGELLVRSSRTPFCDVARVPQFLAHPAPCRLSDRQPPGQGRGCGQADGERTGSWPHPLRPLRAVFSLSGEAASAKF